MSGDAVSPDGGVLQWALDLFLGLAVTVGGGVVKAIRDDHKDLRDDHDELVKGLPETYARRDDVKDGFAELKKQHEQIMAKLDRMAERG